MVLVVFRDAGPVGQREKKSEKRLVMRIVVVVVVKRRPEVLAIA